MSISDREFLLKVFLGNADAADLVLALSRVVDVWDNLIDNDKPVSPDDINSAFFLALTDIPRNPFYLKNVQTIQPMIVNGITNWLIANRIEDDPESTHHARTIAHIIRYSIADVAICCAALIGGVRHAADVGPELRLRSQRDTLENYLNEIEARHANSAL